MAGERDDVNDAVLSNAGGFRLRWDVFLSFRGEDTRATITKSLYEALVNRGVRVFRDDDALERGDEIKPTLVEAIEDSAAAIVVLSRRYADSKWCLDELAKICEVSRRIGLLILPVFYQVEATDVRHQSGPFAEDFRAHEQNQNPEVVAKVTEWKSAMAKVSGTAGYVISHSNEAGSIQAIVKRVVNRVLTEISKTPVGLAAYTVGLNSRVEDVMQLLEVRSNVDVRVVGIHGLGGVGKSTLAKTLFNRLVGRFECHSFISKVRETPAGDEGLLSLQNRLIGSLSPNREPVKELEAGISAIKEIVCEKRVLIVLDDVGNVDQLNALVGSRLWFYEGSRIIVTTRDRQVLPSHLVNKLYEVRELNSSQALQLFSYHALRREQPTENFLTLSKEIVALTGGLPLALEVFGSYLFDKRRMEEWRDALHKLQQIRPRELQDVLKISYDALDEQEKGIFLDIACLFVQTNMKREDAIDIFKACGFDGEIAISDLTAKSLVKVYEDGHLWMHDTVRDMGRQIVRHENLLDPGEHSRLWDRAEIFNVLKNDKGTRKIQGIVLDFQRRWVWDPSGDKISLGNLRESPSVTSAITYAKERYKAHLQHQAERKREIIISCKPLGKMVNLRLLQINNLNLEGHFKFLPPELKWLQWQGCPLKSLPSDFLPRQLAVLDFSYGKLERLWRGNKVAEKLMVLNLGQCSNLTAIPDLSGNRALEKLILEHCVSLNKLHNSIGNLKTLVHLNLRGCLNLTELPSDVSGLRKLERLILSGCSKFKHLPRNMDSFVSLKELILDETSVESLSESIFQLTELEKLSMNRCKFLKGLPELIGKLCSLKEISLNGCSALEKLPDSFGSLANLEILSLFWCNSLATIPDSIGNLSSLMEIHTYGSPIKELPVSIGSLPNLRELSVGYGEFLSKLPGSVGDLNSLAVLKIDETLITDLPHEIGALKTLEKLEMRKCAFLRSLPESIGSMRGLTTIIITGADITKLPESIGMLENLTMLQLNRCAKFYKLPASIGKLKSLHRLQMADTAVTELPESFGMLSGLMVLRIPKKHQKREHTKGNHFILPTSFSNLSSLYELDARACNISGKIADDFEKLSSLEMLNLGRNDFCSLPASLRGLSFLTKLLLPHCKKLKALPPLPSSLGEVNLANCTALESISDISNLENLKELNLANCEKVVDVPGLECLKSLVRLSMTGCSSCSSVIKKRLSKSYMRSLRNLSMPGGKIPDWFSQDVVTFSERKNLVLKGMIIAVVVSVDNQIPDDIREEVPTMVDIQAQILIMDLPKFTSVLNLVGIPKTNEDQVYLCRFPTSDRMVTQLKEGYKIHVTRREPPWMKGVELKKWGIHLVYEGDDDYKGDEESLNENRQSLSQKLAKFYGTF